MLKILNTQQIKAWDAFTIENEPIESIDLMERACAAFVQWFTSQFDATKMIGIICGTGNNGGDGLGIARLLFDWGYRVNVWIVKGAVLESGDFKKNKERLDSRIPFVELTAGPSSGIFSSCDVLVDGIFGSGLSRPVEGIYEEVIQEINNSGVKIVAIDIPSGLFADKHTSSTSVQATHTVTFQCPKLAFLFPENDKRVGRWATVDIGLSKEFLSRTDVTNFIVDRKSVSKRLPKRSKFAHKGDFGKALLIAGSYGKMGACILGARATMRSGAGLLTLHVPRCGYEIVQMAAPEAMASVDDSENHFTRIPPTDDFTTIGIGPGIGQDKETVKAFTSLLETWKKPMVIDADGLNILASNSALLHLLPANSILTPHPGELQRLIGGWSDDFERLEKTKKISTQTKSIIVVKGAHTTITSPDGRVFFNSSGNPGMATAGSGDVLTGIITGLLAQKMEPLDAAICGVYLHGFAGDIAAYDKGEMSLIASDIIDSLPGALKQLS